MKNCVCVEVDIAACGRCGQVFGGPEQHLDNALFVYVLSQVDARWRGAVLRRALGSCVPTDWICMGSYDDRVCGGIHGTRRVSRRPGPVPLSADDLELAELRLR